MTDNKFLIEGIGNPSLPKILTEIRSLAVKSDTLTDEENQRLDTLLFRARAFARTVEPDMTREEIFELVKNATGEKLDIILGDYRGEIPVIACS